MHNDSYNTTAKLAYNRESETLLYGMQ